MPAASSRLARSAESDEAGLSEFLARGQYPGGKNAESTAAWIIRHFPPHSLYVEAFAGSAGIARRKIPALKTVLIDADPVPVKWLRRHARRLVPGATVIHGDAVPWLKQNVDRLPPDALVYLDPPYLLKRQRGKRIVETVNEQPYNVRFTREQHAQLLDIADRAECFIVISGYESELYAERLHRPKWRCSTRTVPTRWGGPAVEHLWHNFDPVEAKANATWENPGLNYRERERIKRKAARWQQRIAAMPAWERSAILAAVLASRDVG